MPSLWIAALKEFNLGKDSWCVPRKGSKDNDKVRRMMKGEAASPVKKPVEKKDMATSAPKAKTPEAPKAKTPEAPKAKTPEASKAKPVKAKKVKVVEPKKEEGKIDNTVDASKLPAIANKCLISQKVSGPQDVEGDHIVMGEKTNWFLPAGDKLGGWYGSMNMTKMEYKKWSHIFTLELKDGVIKGLPELITKLKANKKLMASSDEYGKNAELEDICSDDSTFNNMFEDKPSGTILPDLQFDLPRLTGFDKDDNFDTKWYQWDNYEIVKVERKGEMRESKYSGFPDTFLNGSVTIGLSKFPDDDSALWEWMYMSRNAPAKTDNDKYLKSFEDHVAKTKKYRVKQHAEGKYSEKKNNPV